MGSLLTLIALFFSFSVSAEDSPLDPAIYRTFSLRVDQVLVNRKTNQPVIKKGANGMLNGRSVRFYDAARAKGYEITFFDVPDASYTRVARYSLLRSRKETTDQPNVFHFINFQQRISWSANAFHVTGGEALYIATDLGNGDSSYQVPEAKKEEALLIHDEQLDGGVEKTTYSTKNAYVPLTIGIAMTSNISTYTFTPSTREVALKDIDGKIVAALDTFAAGFANVKALEQALKECYAKPDSLCAEDEKEFKDKDAELDKQFETLLPLEILPKPKSKARGVIARKTAGSL